MVFNANAMFLMQIPLKHDIFETVNDSSNFEAKNILSQNNFEKQNVLIERSCRETFKNAITRHLTPSEDGEPPAPRLLFSVISGYFRLFQNKRRESPHQRNKLL